MSGGGKLGDELLIRTDASATIGVGHAMRCLALAEAWLDEGGRVTFAMNEAPDLVAERVVRTGARLVRVQTADDTARLAGELGAKFAVLDGYHLGASHQDALARAGARLLVIDDAGETATPAAVLVLNQNPYASRNLYSSLGSEKELLLGLDFVLLRREFRAMPAARTTPEVARRLLVTFGGADTANLAPRAIEALAPLDGIEALVLAGGANARAGELSAPPGARASVRIETYVEDIVERMRASDLAIATASSTSWELAASGVPIVCIVAAENQCGVAASIVELGLGETLGPAEEVSASAIRDAVVRLAGDATTRSRMARRGPELVDGRGAQRVCAALRGLASAGRSGGS
jgi:UDP-2,4-diacetamido-2,4,6-trideoxy-beta-L-altropyranose hydrolase